MRAYQARRACTSTSNYKYGIKLSLLLTISSSKKRYPTKIECDAFSNDIVDGNYRFFIITNCA